MDRLNYIFSHFIPCANRDPARIYRGDLRKNVLKKYKNQCAICYCHEDVIKKPLQIHHILPWNTGGYTNLENAIPLCHDICHPLADLDVWSPEYLYGINNKPASRRLEKLLDLSSSVSIEETIKKVDADNLSPNLYWKGRLNKLIDNWAILSHIHKSIAKTDFIETSAKLLWSISKVITTYVPDKKSDAYWRCTLLPQNRVVGINLGEKARSIIKRYVSDSNPEKIDLMVGITHTISTHYRSFGYYDSAFRQDKKHMNILQKNGVASSVIRNPSSRAYYLSAYCIDLAELKKFKAGTLIDLALKWAKESGNMHSIADTMVRASEVELRLDKPDECLKYLDKKNDFGSAWELIMQDIPIVRTIAHKVCMQAHACLGNWSDANFHYKEGLNIAINEKLEDQNRKILEIYNKIKKEQV